MKIFVFLLLVFLDYYSKKIIFNLMDLNNIITLLPFVDIIHIHNYGVLFGLFAGKLPTWIIIFVGIMITIFIIYLADSSKYIVY